jgi:serpin B
MMIPTILCALFCAAAQETPRTEKEFTTRTLDFSFKLHHAIAKESPGKNVFISPTSILIAFGMAASGARGETQEEIVKVLGLEGWKREDVDRQIGAMLDRWTAPDQKVRLEIANSFWAAKDFGFHDDYIKGLQKAYRATADSVDFTSGATADRIDQWVVDHTAGKIPTIVQRPIPADTVLFLINAVYFKGEWTEQFDPAASQAKIFHLPDGKPSLPVFMTKMGRFQYLKTPEFASVRIPYGAKGQVGFYLFLPTDPKAADATSLGLTAATWHGWHGQGPSSYRKAEGTIQFPKFKSGSKVNLIPVLKGMGMKRPFMGGADFSGMSPAGKKFVIDSALHKTFVDVNEKGTEAAAVTALRASVTSAGPPPFVFIADRPFFCAIVDDETETFLFTGWIADPR